MREIVQTSRFKSDIKKLARSGRHDVDEMIAVIEMLAADKTLPEKYKDHPLSGSPGPGPHRQPFGRI